MAHQRILVYIFIMLSLIILGCNNGAHNSYVLQSAIRQMNRDALDELGHVITESESVCYGSGTQLLEEVYLLRSLTEKHNTISEKTVIQDKIDYQELLSKLEVAEDEIVKFVTSTIESKRKELRLSARDSVYLQGYIREIEIEDSINYQSYTSITKYNSGDNPEELVLKSVANRNKWIDLLLNVLRGKRTDYSSQVYPTILRDGYKQIDSKDRGLAIGLVLLDHSFNPESVVLIYRQDTIKAVSSIFNIDVQRDDIKQNLLSIELQVANPITGDIFSREYQLHVR